MRNAAKVAVHFSPGIEPQRTLEHCIRGHAEELREAGVAAEIFVDAVPSPRGMVNVVTILIGDGADPTVVRVTHPDAFVAVRDAFLDVRRWIGDETPALAGW